MKEADAARRERSSASAVPWSSPNPCEVAQDRATLRPGFHFKVRSFMRQFAIDKGTPKYYALVKQDNTNGLQERLAGRDADGASAAEQARAPTRKIAAQVDEHMPRVDASRAHARIDVQQQAWML